MEIEEQGNLASRAFAKVSNHIVPTDSNYQKKYCGTHASIQVDECVDINKSKIFSSICQHSFIHTTSFGSIASTFSKATEHFVRKSEKS